MRRQKTAEPTQRKYNDKNGKEKQERKKKKQVE
jgi:hypothetical protein